MNSIQILKCIKAFICLKKKFSYGVFASDQLPTSFVKPALFVINYDDSKHSGSHWISMFFAQNGEAEYFDSYSLGPIKRFKKYLKRHSTKYTFNKKRLQGDFSSCCGHYCCIYLFYKCNNMSMNSFTKCFSDNNLDYNDEKILKYFQTVYKMNREKIQISPTTAQLLCNQKCEPRGIKEMKISNL
jgi:hypothetical protein